VSGNMRRLQGRDQASSYGEYGSARPPTPSAAIYRTATSTPSSMTGSFRAATPNAKGQYADSVMDTLESQNDDTIEGLSQKVRMIKDVRGNPMIKYKCANLG
jgi:blocked-early-in-transport protein 1